MLYAVYGTIIHMAPLVILGSLYRVGCCDAGTIQIRWVANFVSIIIHPPSPSILNPPSTSAVTSWMLLAVEAGTL